MSRRRSYPAFLLGLLAAAGCYIGLCIAIGLDLFAHSPYDSYSLQAMLWRNGTFCLTEDRPWLELAVYEGRYYISFPPFPTLVMLPLTFIFGENTPGTLVSFACVLGSYGFGYLLARRRGIAPLRAAMAAVFLVLGCNLCEYGLYGGVWNVAQAMAFLLSVAAFYSMAAGRVYPSLILIACAVGCRPFQAVYVPFLVCAAWKKKGLKRLLPALIVPALIAAAYAFYNYIRFGNIFQFGHDYLPEFARQSEHGQFSVHYIGKNLSNIFRLPFFEDGHLSFPTAFGFAFYLCNPIFVLFLLSFSRKVIGKTVRPLEYLLTGSIALHFFLLLMHKSFGGVQFGTRYLCDLIPAMYFLWAAPKRGWEKYTAYALGAWGVLFNIYGAWYFHVLVGA